MFRKITSQLFSSTFFRHNLIFLAGSVAVGVANYVYYPVMGRLLDPASFGEVQALVSLFLQLIVFLNVLTQVSINIATNYTDESKKQRVLFELEKIAFYIGCTLAVFLAVFSWKLRDLLQFESIWPFILLLAAVVLTVPPTFRGAYLRARKAFGAASVANLLGSVGKILLSVGLVLLGFEVVGAIGGLVLAQVVMFGYAAYKARQLGFVSRTRGYTERPQPRLLLPELKYAALVLVSSGTITFLTSVDIIVVKHLFDPQLAGEYAGISTIAKIIFFLTASISQVLLPSLRIQNKHRDNRALLLKSLAFLAALALPVVVFFSFFSTFTVGLLMGREYLPFADLLPLLSVIMFLISVINITVLYYVALRRYTLGIAMLFAILISIGILWAHHHSVHQVAQSVLYSCLATLFVLAVWRIKNTPHAVGDTHDPTPTTQTSINNHSRL